MAILVLNVDGRSDSRQALTAFLEDLGYAVTEAQDGASAVDAAPATLPDVILLDLLLPDMAGIEVLNRLKQAEQTAAIPVVVVSAVTDAKVVRNAIRAGASDYILKPWSGDDLETVLEWVLKRSGKQPPIRAHRFDWFPSRGDWS